MRFRIAALVAVILAIAIGVAAGIVLKHVGAPRAERPARLCATGTPEQPVICEAGR